jgi:hypothetical protein
MSESAEEIASLNQPESAGRSTMAVHLDAGEVRFRIDTATDHSLELVSLAAKLELALQMLAEKNNQLESAIKRIGQLEAECSSYRDSASHNATECEVIQA